jgi:hypothetical protein
MRVVPFLLCAFLLLTATAFAQTTTLSAQTSNNTAACAAAGSPSYCKAGWSGLSDSASGAYDPVPGNPDLVIPSGLQAARNLLFCFARPDSHLANSRFLAALGMTILGRVA